MSSAWIDVNEEQNIKDIDKKFEDNFVTVESEKFDRLEDSDSYLKLLGLSNVFVDDYD